MEEKQDNMRTTPPAVRPSENHPALSRKQSLKELESLSSAILASVGEATPALEDYYVRLAQEAEQSETPSGNLDQAVQQEIESLKRTSGNLNQALQATNKLEDELSARFFDMRTSRDRKWYLPNPPANGSIDLEEQQRDHFARGINLYKLLLVCFVGSFAGVVVEMLWCLVRNGYIESRAGLVYGPFNLLYGAGAVVLTLALYRYRNRGYLLSFLGGMIVGSVVEYVCSWGQEALFGSRSWDYSNLPFNLNGRICLLYSVFWGVLGVLWIKDLYPRMAKWILKIPNRAGKIMTWCLTAFLVINAVVTCVAVARWSQRVQGDPPASSFWSFVDERFPDERMERIFANMEFGSTQS